jgi:outer membrane protein assembly factor BamD (BamD/ComL family)
MNPPNSTAEDQYWNNISNSQRAQDFQGYLYNYPNGTYASLARLRISQLGGNTTQSSPVVSAVEEQYWNNVKNSQRPQDFQDYLNTYPSGQYALIARLRINQLSVSTPAQHCNGQFGDSGWRATAGRTHRFPDFRR